MKKAIMYLLLALGITLVVLFIGGALVGFVAGFIDGFKGEDLRSATSMTYMVGVGSVSIIILCVILNWVFLKYGFASYTIGRIPNTPKSIKWKVLLGSILVMAGFAIMSYPLFSRDMSDKFMIDSYVWMHDHLLFSILVIAALEATVNLVIYGAILREVLEWKHRPWQVILAYSCIMSLFSFFSFLEGTPSFPIMTMVIAQFEGWMYEYTRSVIPIIIGDVAFWIVTLCMVGVPASGWFLLVGALVAGFSALLALNPMEPYKPLED